MSDTLIKAFVGGLKRQIADKEQELPDINFTGIYHAGIMQGEIRGLRDALALLEQIIEDTDKE